MLECRAPPIDLSHPGGQLGHLTCAIVVQRLNQTTCHRQTQQTNATSSASDAPPRTALGTNPKCPRRLGPTPLICILFNELNVGMGHAGGGGVTAARTALCRTFGRWGWPRRAEPLLGTVLHTSSEPARRPGTRRATMANAGAWG